MAKKNGGINPVYMYNNKALGTKAVLDFKGNNRANAIQNEVIRAKQNQYVFENWPFKKQSWPELMFYLYRYGKVIYLDIPNVGWLFFPFESSLANSPYQLLTEMNITNATLTIKGYWNKNIGAEKFITDDIKKTMPFIFMNSTQTSPHDEQIEIFGALAAVYNSNFVNRKYKNLSMIMEVPKGTKYEKQVYEHYTEPQASSILFVESNGKKTNNMSAKKYVEIGAKTPDLYASYFQEETNLLQELKLRNGIPRNVGFLKNSAQETDQQTANQKTEIAFNLKNEYDQLKRDFARLNKNMSKQVSIWYADELWSYVYEILGNVSRETKEELETAVENNDTNLITRIFKKLFKKASEEKDEVPPPEEEESGVDNE